MGPCSAESREQVLLTAGQIQEACGEHAFIFRAGVWKPRTSPHTFQGAGEEGLNWLAEVKKTFGVPVATEVATPEHVEAAVRAGIDYVWIGARSSANPMAVQSISSAICDLRQRMEDFPLKAILVKNPVNADAQLWLGNIERLEQTHLPVLAIHRGCNHQPYWSMAHEVRLARPDIPMLLDPSHMSGDAKRVPELLKKVDELGLDGAMVEVHCNPADALSDSAQQIKPDELHLQHTAGDAVELNWWRAEIDELDDRLWEILSARMEISERIGAWKKANAIAPLQPERYQQIVERIKSRAESEESKNFMLHVWDLIHEQSLKKQV